MKHYTSILALASVLAMGACSDMNEISPAGGTLTQEQLSATNLAIPSRADAVFSGMYSKLALSINRFKSDRPDDGGFISIAFSNDIESGDIVLADNGYNWFSVCGEMSSRNADYANPYVRYVACYDAVARAHDVMNTYGDITEDTSDEDRYKIAQAYAMRAYAYMHLAPYFQFRYVDAKDEPCVPIVTRETVDFTNNPRATVAQVYDLIVSDLTYAIDNLEGYERPDKAKVDQQVAYGLRARAYLNMAMYAEAAADAAKAAAGYTPATMQEVSSPSFYNIKDHNWIWGYDMTTPNAQKNPYATADAWIRSFSGDGYSAGTGTYARINNILYDKIPSSDIRKQWWVDASLHTSLLDGQRWGDAEGEAIVSLEIENVKLAFDPYTNVKFGMLKYGDTMNDSDWPLMRVEEMILIQAEGLAKSGNTAEAIRILNDFVSVNRDPEYDAANSNFSLEDEIWFQRRIELWGEGFANADTRRLGKPFVRFTNDDTSIVPEAFRFNMAADDPYLLMRFCTDELNTNKGVVDNKGGSKPVSKQNPELRDGVTD